MYDADNLDDEEYESMTREQREAAEKVMEEREARGDSGDRQAQAEDMRDERFAGLEDDDDEYETLEDGQRVPPPLAPAGDRGQSAGSRAWAKRARKGTGRR